MAKFIKNNLGNFLVILVIAILVFAGAIYYSSKHQLMQASVQKIEIFPTGYTIYFEGLSVDEPGWQNPERALFKNLEPTANFEQFNEENSSYPFEAGSSEDIEKIIIDEFMGEQIATGSAEPVLKGQEPEQIVSSSQNIEDIIKEEFIGEELVSESEQTLLEPEQIVSSSQNIEDIIKEEFMGEEEEIIPIPEEEKEEDEPVSLNTPPVKTNIWRPLLEAIASESEKNEDVEESSFNVGQETASVSEEWAFPYFNEPTDLEFNERIVEYFNFDLPDDFIKDRRIKNAQLRLSLAYQNGGPEDKLMIDYMASDSWEPLADYFLDKPVSNAVNHDYWLHKLPNFSAQGGPASGGETWEEIENLRFRFVLKSAKKSHPLVYLDALWLEVEYESAEAEEIQKEAEVNLISGRKDFKSDEEPEFEFKYQRKAGLLKKTVNLFRDEYKDINIKATVLGLNISPNIRYEKNGEFFVDLPKLPRQFRPGKYKLKIEIEDPSINSGQAFIQEQEFTWGVLAINTNKSIYTKKDSQAYLQMAVLNDRGHTICDAKLKLEIKEPRGGLFGLGGGETTILSTEDGTIQYSGKCGPNNVVDVPDYFTYYQISDKTGIYEMKLTNLDNGSTSSPQAGYEIIDSFEVKKEVPFDVERIGPTRIYPPASYEMKIKIRVNQDFVGEIKEYVPESFKILNAKPYTLNPGQIIWQVDWKGGETYELKYQFDAPDVSPYLYLLGPLEFYE